MDVQTVNEGGSAGTRQFALPDQLSGNARSIQYRTPRRFGEILSAPPRTSAEGTRHRAGLPQLGDRTYWQIATPHSEQFRSAHKTMKPPLWQVERAVDRLWRGRSNMRRRELLTLLGGAAGAWPFAAWAARASARVVSACSCPSLRAMLRPRHASRRRARPAASGLAGGANLLIDYRSAGSDPASIRRHAARWSHSPDMVVAGSLAPHLCWSAQHSDRDGECSRPGWRRLGAKPGAARRQRHRLHQFRVQLGRQVDRIAQASAPSITRVAVLRSATSVAGIGQFAAVQSGSHSFGIELTPVGCVMPTRSSVAWRHLRAPAPVV